MTEYQKSLMLNHMKQNLMYNQRDNSFLRGYQEAYDEADNLVNTVHSVIEMIRTENCSPGMVVNALSKGLKAYEEGN